MAIAPTPRRVNPRRYFEGVRARNDVPEHEPVCLYLETTNRCNLLCTTCPRTYVTSIAVSPAAALHSSTRNIVSSRGRSR